MSETKASSDVPTIWTIGHSNRTWEDFLKLLEESSIKLLADVRRLPGSRKHPHFDQEVMTKALREDGIAYEHFPELGGRRGKRSVDSPNGGWQVEAFGAYADYMESSDFRDAIKRLQDRASGQRTAIMCAEAVPWRCHRRLIADALTVRGWQALDIVSHGKVTPHRLTSFAQYDGQRLIYPAAG